MKTIREPVHSNEHKRESGFDKHPIQTFVKAYFVYLPGIYNQNLFSTTQTNGGAAEKGYHHLAYRLSDLCTRIVNLVGKRCVKKIIKVVEEINYETEQIK